MPSSLADSSTIPQPRLNHFSCRIQERFQHNHPAFAIFQPQLNHSQKDSHPCSHRFAARLRLGGYASTTRCRRYKTLSDFIPTTTTLCKRSGDGGGEGRALRGRMRPRDWRRGNGSHAGRQTECRSPVHARNLPREIRAKMSSRPRFKV